MENDAKEKCYHMVTFNAESDIFKKGYAKG